MIECCRTCENVYGCTMRGGEWIQGKNPLDKEYGCVTWQEDRFFAEKIKQETEFEKRIKVLEAKK